jgi:hypothetical protein
VKAVFGVSKQKPGKYVVTVSHEDDDWYEVWNKLVHQDIELPVPRPWRGGLPDHCKLRFGRLRFKDGDDCMVEAVYTKLRL